MGTFKNFKDNDLGTAYTSIYTAPSTGPAIILQLQASNIDGTDDADVSVKWIDNSDTSAETVISKNIVIPAGTSVGLIDGKFVLEANDSISALASATGDVSITGSVLEV